MELLGLHPRLADPLSLFRLTESTDRRLRYFAVEAIWRVYRQRGLSPGWSPDQKAGPEQPVAPVTAGVKAGAKGTKAGSKAKASQAVKAESVQPEAEPAKKLAPPTPWIADAAGMQAFLRRMLFELPPGREPGQRRQVKTLPASKAKLALVETYQSMALSERDFAALAVPVLREFMASRGQLEARACLVALTRIAQRFPEFDQLDNQPSESQTSEALR
jgi:hypothetical protein